MSERFRAGINGMVLAFILLALAALSLRACLPACPPQAGEGELTCAHAVQDLSGA